jgi:hypothetical protein
MFRRMRVIIKEFFCARWIKCESNALVDKIMRYMLLRDCYVETGYAPILDDDTHASKHVGAPE